MHANENHENSIKKLYLCMKSQSNLQINMQNENNNNIQMIQILGFQ